MLATSAMYQDFDWATAPLASLTAPVATGALYLVSVCLIPLIVPAGGFKSLKWILFSHNAILSIGSAIIFIGTAVEMLKRVSREGSGDWMFCENPATTATGPLFFWSYLYYVSKYYELFDTILALLKGSRPPNFNLHIYHHAFVLLMAWSYLEYRMTMHPLTMLYNTAVHVVMYAYYAFKVLQWPTPWKDWVTRLQIFQFMCNPFFLLIHLRYVEGLDVFGTKCAGETALWGTTAFVWTLLPQFVMVLQRNKSGHAKGASALASAAHEKSS